MRWRKRRSCSSSPTVRKYLSSVMPDSVISASRCGISCRKRVRRLLGAVAHDPLDARAVVPAAVEDQHLAGGGQLLDVALHVDLGLLPVRRRRQRDDAEHPRADPLGQALDHAALAGGVAALEDDDDAGAARLHPGLQVGDLDLQPGELLLVGLVAGLLRVGGSGCGGRLGVLCLLVLLAHGVPPFGLVASKARSASSRSSKIMSGPMAASSPARSSRPRTSAWSSARPKADAAGGEVGAHLLEHRRGGRVDLGDGAGVEEQPAGAGRHRVGDGVQPGVDVVGVEEQEVALDQRDRQAGDRLRVRAAVQLVEAVAARERGRAARRADTSSCAGGRRRSRRSRRARRSAPRG